MAATKIKVNNNGPLLVEGDVEIVDPSGKAFGFPGRAVIALCRCGHSAAKPLCDGSHKAAFSHQVEACEFPPPKPKPNPNPA
jgi:CDGSH-type Zn-finger protein